MLTVSSVQAVSCLLLLTNYILLTCQLSHNVLAFCFIEPLMENMVNFYSFFLFYTLFLVSV